MCRRILWTVVVCSFLTGCVQERAEGGFNPATVSLPPVEIHRYEHDLFSLDTTQLEQELDRISHKYKLFLGDNYRDSLNLVQLKNYLDDPFLREVAGDCRTLVPDLAATEKTLHYAFKYYRFCFPDAVIPEVFTYISGFDLENRIIVTDSALLIAIDTYLGNDYPKYRGLGIPEYRIRAMDIAWLVVDCMKELARGHIDRDSTGFNLLEQAVFEGKLHYFVRRAVPSAHDTILMAYTAQQLFWAHENETLVWAFILENGLLYSSDIMKTRKFITDAPFTSFFSDASPPRLGIWLGWRIVEGYMNKNRSATMGDLFWDYDAQKILTLSGFRPAGRL